MFGELSREWFADLTYVFSIPDFKVNGVMLCVNPSFDNEFSLVLHCPSSFDLRQWRESYKGLIYFPDDHGEIVITYGQNKGLTKTELIEELSRLRSAGFLFLSGRPSKPARAIENRWNDPSPFDATTFFECF